MRREGYHCKTTTELLKYALKKIHFSTSIHMRFLFSFHFHFVFQLLLY